MSSIKKYTMLALLSLAFYSATASHTAGGNSYYTYKGDTTISGVPYHIYRVTFELYVDCYTGQPEAIAQDNPAYISVYEGNAHLYRLDSVDFTTSLKIPVTFETVCGHGIVEEACMIQKTFVTTYYLPSNNTGYVIAYQRCCRNFNIVNITNSGDVGVTYSCTIPAMPLLNSSPVFKSMPLQAACNGMPYICDHSATDADGDSLSYGLCTALDGASGQDVKPVPAAPPYVAVPYISPFAYNDPIPGSVPFSIHPATGIITGTPNRNGRYLVAVACYEWRNAVVIDSVVREFELIVKYCDNSDYQSLAGNDTAIFVGDSVLFHAQGARTYSWSPATYLSDPDIANPIGHFTVAGHFNYTLRFSGDSGCNGTAVRRIWVLDHSQFVVPNAFSPNGDNINDRLTPIAVYGCTLQRFRIYNRWGNMVYSGDTNDPGWDGTCNGTKQDIGVYVWQIIYLDNYGTERSLKGNVTLIR